MGDWSEAHQMKNHEPTKGKSMRKLFKDRGYQLYLVDEFNTSKRNCESGQEMANCQWDVKHNKYVHRLLGLKILNNGKEVNKELIKHLLDCGYKVPLMNRDLNGSLNIRNKGLHQLYDSDVPVFLDRSKNGGNEKKYSKSKQHGVTKPVRICLPTIITDAKRKRVPMKVQKVFQDTNAVLIKTKHGS
jgi:hypothetical protein